MNARGIIFDLDGTLIDSRSDLAFSINLMLADLRLRQLDSKRVVEFVGEGIHRLIERALNESLDRPPEEAELNAGLESFNYHYDRHLLDRTKLYPSVKK